MKANELGQKSEELQRFERYNDMIKDEVEKLKKIQTLIINGVDDGRAILGKISLQSYQTEEWGSTLGGKASFFDNCLEMEIKTTVSLALLRALEKDIIRKIKLFAQSYGFEEDRFKPIFDEYIDLDKYKYGGWFD